MNKTLMGLAVLPFVAGTAMAAQPLSDKQMDKVTAGHIFVASEVTDVSFILINVGVPPVASSAAAAAGGTVLGDVVLPLTTIQVLWGAIP